MMLSLARPTCELQQRSSWRKTGNKMQGYHFARFLLAPFLGGIRTLKQYICTNECAVTGNVWGKERAASVGDHGLMMLQRCGSLAWYLVLVNAAQMRKSRGSLAGANCGLLMQSKRHSDDV